MFRPVPAMIEAGSAQRRCPGCGGNHRGSVTDGPGPAGRPVPLTFAPARTARSATGPVPRCGPPAARARQAAASCAFQADFSLAPSLRPCWPKARHSAIPLREDLRQYPGPSTLISPSMPWWAWLPVAFGLTMAGAAFGGAGPARRHSAHPHLVHGVGDVRRRHVRGTRTSRCRPARPWTTAWTSPSERRTGSTWWTCSPSWPPQAGRTTSRPR